MFLQIITEKYMCTKLPNCQKCFYHVIFSGDRQNLTLDFFQKYFLLKSHQIMSVESQQPRLNVNKYKSSTEHYFELNGNLKQKYGFFNTNKFDNRRVNGYKTQKNTCNYN